MQLSLLKKGMRGIVVCCFVLTVMAGLPQTGAARTPSECPKSMRSLWEFNESGGSVFGDYVGSNHALCAGTCPEPVAGGRVLGGQRFNRLFATGVNVPGGSFNWGKRSSFTLEFWMQKEGACSGSQVSANEVILGRDSEDQSNGLHWWVGVDCMNAPPQGVVKFSLTDKSGDGVSLVGTRDVTDWRWHHVVAVRDGVHRRNLLYVDGRLEASEPFEYASGFEAGETPVNIGWLNLSQGFYYTGIVDEVAIYDGVLPEDVIRSHYLLARGYCRACDRPVRILPLGDSITAGGFSGTDNPASPGDSSRWTSYRRDLWLGMKKAGYCADFVGTQQGGSFFGDFDLDHEGHNGWSDTQIADNIYGWLAGSQPDVVLLHIGTNDLNASPLDVKRILDRVDAYDEDITVVLARIINRVCPTPPCPEVALTTQFNDNVQVMAEGRIAQGDRLILVDQETGAGIKYDIHPAGDMWDLVHPYATGYRKMANTWLASLETFLPECRPTAPRFTSSPDKDALLNLPYRYAVTAKGIPAPVFWLETVPDGMSINSTTGQISWTPQLVGRYAVTVVAENSSGRQSQRFMINVSDCTRITEQPSNVSAVEGRAATFKVRAKCPRGIKLSYQWFRDGIAIQGATRSSYRLSRVAPADHGARFTCVVSGGECPGVQSNPAILSVTSATRP